MSNEKIIELAKIGSRIEQHYGGPMDIEWCMEEGNYVVQARPVTTIGGRGEPTTLVNDNKSNETK